MDGWMQVHVWMWMIVRVWAFVCVCLGVSVFVGLGMRLGLPSEETLCGVGDEYEHGEAPSSHPYAGG
eukprot:1158266-Pelagomonas_calceolata.AAC.2